MRLLLKIALLILTVGISYAHQDRYFDLGPDGEIVGLPMEFSPAHLAIGPVRSDESTGYFPSPNVRIQLSGVMREFEPCVAQLFLLPAGEQIRLHGSWYHDTERLPPYIVIDLPSQSYEDIGWFTGYSLLLNLRTAELLEVRQRVVTPGPVENAVGTTQREVPAYEALCGRPLAADHADPEELQE